VTALAEVTALAGQSHKNILLEHYKKT